MPILCMMVGLPASGKTFYANKQNDGVVLSSDAIREELGITTYGPQQNKLVFDTLHERMLKALGDGIDVWHDATNISRRDRMRVLSMVGDDICKVAIVMSTPFNTCLERNARRDRSVPEHVMRKMLRRFQMPLKGEGFDEVICIPCSEDYVPLVTPEELVDFDQESKWHSLTLDEHMRKTICGVFNMPDDVFPEGQLVSRNHSKRILLDAAALHDVGKSVTKVFVDGKGKKSEHAHYYGHEHAGAYMVLSETDTWEVWDERDRYLVSAVIDNHMRPMVWNDGKSVHAKERDRALFGDWLCDMLELHGKADMEAH